MINFNIFIFGKSTIVFLIFFIAVFSCIEKKETKEEPVAIQKPKHPQTKKKSHTKEIHGVSLHDEYFWMQEKENPEVLAHLKEENEYIDSIMKDTKNLQQTLYKELLSRASADIKYLKKIGQNVYFSKNEVDKQYPIIYKRSSKDIDKEEIIFDFNEHVPDNVDFSLAFFEVSPDQQQFTFAIKQDTADAYSLIIKNINNRSIGDTIPEVSKFAVWAEDSQTLFYTTNDENGRSDKVFNHKIYLPYEEDKLEYYEEDPEFHVSLNKSKNNKYIFVQTESSSSSETHYLNADDPNQGVKLFSSRLADRKYEVYPHESFFFILAEDKSSNGRRQLFKATKGATESKNWQLAEINNEAITIEDIDMYSDFIVLYKSEKGLPFIEIKDFVKNTTEQLLFDETNFVVKPVNATTYDDEVFQYEYESLSSAPSIYQVNFKTKERVLLKSSSASDFNKDNFTTERIIVQAEDGAEIHLSLIYPKGLNKDASAPLYLYGNGTAESHSFPQKNSSVNFNNRISLLNRGFIFAIAHVRGSWGLGEAWHQHGKRKLKKNSISDYIKCAEFLINNGYTSQDKLVATGEGAGAILAGASLNVHPELFEIVVLKNPNSDLLDTVRYENNFQSIEEFGDPKDVADFNFLLTYSPYDNIEVKAYPNVLIFSNFNHKSIPYYEATKWAARLREYNTDPNKLIMLKTDFSYKRKLSSQLKDVALEYAFVLETLGVKPKKSHFVKNNH